MLILLTGGSACGKSTYAEKLAIHHALPRYYIATMRPYGQESQKKIDRHRMLRSTKGFTTIERYTALHEIQFPKRGTALLECMCNLTANEMFDDAGNLRDPYEDILRAIDSLQAQCDTLIVVTNEVGSDGEEYTPETMQYMQTLGKLNIELTQRADCVLELVCGIPLVLKGELPE